MKKIFITFFSLFSIINFSKAQFNLLNYNWRFIDTASVAGQRIEGWGVDADMQNDIYWPVFYKAQSGNLQIRCRKFDSNGNELWNPPFNYSKYPNQISYVAFVNDSDLYIGGKKFDLNPFSTDMLLIRCDKNSGIIKNDTTYDFGMNGYDELDAIQTSVDGIYCSGWAQSVMTGAYENEIGIWKLNYNFGTDYAITHGVANTAEHADGHMVLDSDFIYLTGLWGGDGIANLFDGKAFLGKFNRNTGALTDSILFGLSSPWINAENSLTITEHGNYLFTCGYTTSSANNWDVFLAKFDKNLNQLNYTIWGDAGTESARAIVVHNNLVFVGANTRAPSPVISGQGDAAVLVYDTSGNFINSFYYDNGANENIYDMAINGNTLYVSGTSNDSINDQPVEAFLLSVQISNISTITQNRKNEIEVFPNPFSSSITISFPNKNDKPTSVCVKNVLGSAVFNKSLQPKANSQQLDLTFLPKGLYFLELDVDSYKIVRKILKL